MSYWKSTENHSLANDRENLFALRTKLEFACAGTSYGLTKEVINYSLQQRLYHQIVGSLAWEFELPFVLYMSGKYDGFPWRQLPEFKDNVEKVRKVRAIPQDELRAEEKRISTIKDDAKRVKAERDLQIRNEMFDRTVERMTDIEIYTLIESDEMRDILRAVDDFGEGGFGSIDAREHVADVMKEVLERSYARNDYISMGCGHFLLADFNSVVQDMLQPLKVPIRMFLADCWRNHARHLADAMTVFDFMKSRVRVNDFLMFENVPEDVLEAYHKSFYSFSEGAEKICNDLRLVNKKINEYEVKGDDLLQIEVEIMKNRYVILEDSFRNFAEFIKGPRSSHLVICDCSPTGFLNYLLPLI